MDLNVTGPLTDSCNTLLKKNIIKVVGVVYNIPYLFSRFNGSIVIILLLTESFVRTECTYKLCFYSVLTEYSVRTVCTVILLVRDRTEYQNE